MGAGEGRSRGPSDGHGPRAFRSPAGRAEPEPDLLTDVREVLAADGPLPLLVLTSSLLDAVEPAPTFTQQRDDGPTLQELVDSFAGVPRVETSALLTAFAELATDEVLQQRIHRELDSRDHALPSWLEDLTPPQVDRTLAATHVLGDLDIHVVEARPPDGAAFTAVVYVQHDLGTVVTDGFCYLGTADAVTDQLIGFDDPDLDVSEIAPADARARISEAIETGRITWPPYETDTWPAFRPLVEWVVRGMPTGGTGHERPHLDEEDQARIAERFFASPYGRGHDHPDGRDLLESLLWYGCDYGTGDPLTWGSTAVEILLADWLPRKVVADVDLLGLAPDLLRSFIRFGHDERGIRDELTADALEAVDELAPDYQRVIRSDRPQGPAALLAAMGVIDEGGAAAGGPFGGGSVPSFADIYRRVLDGLLRAVGGEEALATVTVDPLPDEPFDWGRIPDDIHDKVADVLAMLDECAEDLLDVEYRTAFRRFLADVASADPEIFRRRGWADTAAAAVAWTVGKANELFDSHGDGLSIGELTDWFGVASSPASRADTMLGALGLERDYASRDVHLGTPRYLVSQRRREIIRRREHVQQELVRDDTLAAALDDPWGHGVIGSPWEGLELGVDPAPTLPWSPPDPVDVLAVGWFPADAFAEAARRWPPLVDRIGTDDYAAYARMVQATLVGLARDFGLTPVLVRFDPDELDGFADHWELDPADRRTRAALAVEVADRGETVAWPPGRNHPCWCGSGHKYKRCCDTVPADPARRDAPTATTEVSAYEFDIDLADVRPRIWRRVRLAADGTFRDLHDAIQVACDWHDYHLFAFSTPDGRVVAGSGFDDGFADPEPDAGEVSLTAYFERHDRCVYEYDFGDGWRHDIVVRDRITGPADHQRQLVAGDRAFPPEDCGGLSGYERAVQVAAGGPDPEGFADWLGDWHPDRFDLEGARRRFDR